MAPVFLKRESKCGQPGKIICRAIDFLKMPKLIEITAKTWVAGDHFKQVAECFSFQSAVDENVDLPQ